MARKRTLDLLVIGTDPQGEGGIAAVASALLNAPLLRRYRHRYLVSHAAGGRWRKSWFALRAVFSMALLCWCARPAIVHAHVSTGGSFVRKALLLAVARRCGCATVLHMHGSRFRQFAGPQANCLKLHWIRRTMERASVVIALSESWAEFMRALAPRARVEVIFNGVAWPDPANGSGSEAGRILFLGEIGQRKGAFDLLQAVALLAPDFPQVRLALGGGGDLAGIAAAARRLHIEDKVELLGWLGPEEKARQLDRAHIFCLPSKNEGLPMAMLEAMAAARPVVTTPVGGIPEAVRDGVQGLLVAPGDPDGLSKALGRLLCDPALARQMGQCGQQAVRERFHANAMVCRLDRLYQELLAVRQAAPVSAIAPPGPVRSSNPGRS
jgi:glycosyltransferase involved in cell wall biosynthesis